MFRLPTNILEPIERVMLHRAEKKEGLELASPRTRNDGRMCHRN